MSADVYDPPEGFDPPSFEDDEVDGKFDINKMIGNEQAYITRLREWLGKNGYDGELAGEEVRWGRGDGYARYLVLSLRPLRLMHLPVGDAWRMDPIFERGLTAKDIRQKVTAQRKMTELFSGKGTTL